MLSPTKQRMEIKLCTLNFEEIEIKSRALLSQISRDNTLSVNQSNDIKAALEVLRSMNKETASLTTEMMMLKAKCVEIERQSNERYTAMQKEEEINTNLKGAITLETDALDKLITDYKAHLTEITKRAKETSSFYYKENVMVEIQEMETLNREMSNDMTDLETDLQKLQVELEKLGEPQVPANILSILGKDKLTEELENVTQIYNELVNGDK